MDDSLILSDNDDRLPLSSTCEHWISSNFSQPCCNGSTEGVGETICIISRHTRGQNVHLYSCLSKRCSVQPSMLDLLLIIASFQVFTQFETVSLLCIRHHLIKHTFQQTFIAGAPLIAGIYTWPTSPITLSGAGQLINPENISKEEERVFVERREQKHTKCPHQPTPNTLI